MKISETIGIDMSKLYFDTHLYSNQMHNGFENNNNGFESMLKWVYKSSSFLKEEILFVFEHTGLYSYCLSVFLTDLKIPFILVPGLAIKRSLGISRGKDDKIDAKRIAQYAYRLRDEIKPYKLPSEQIRSLKSLLSLRGRFVKQRAGFKASLREQKLIFTKKLNKTLFETQERTINYLSKQIKRIEDEMGKIIKNDEGLKEQFNLIISIKGVGVQTALFMIAFTSSFTKFKNSRKFASYCGIAPFPYLSGSSIRGRSKVSNLANKKIKSLLDLCAKSAIQHNTEMKLYYNRRIEKGKNKMSTINIVRNKILARIFAVIERKTPYVDFMKYAA